MLDPQARQLIASLAERGVRPVYELSAAEARAGYHQRRALTQPVPVAVGVRRDLRAKTRAGDVPLRLWRPSGASDAQALPVLVFFHGGGFLVGDLDTHEALCRSLCAQAGCAVVAVDYRMAPEHRFPAAVDDAIGATRWLADNAEALAIDPARLALAGDSAGGNLAAVVSLALRDDADLRHKPLLQVLIYPVTDFLRDTPSFRQNAEGYMLTARSMNHYEDTYCASELKTDWRASPLRAARHDGLPPALVITAGFDPLCDEGRAYADRLSAAGVPTQYVNFARQIHGFIVMGRVIDEADAAIALCAHALRRAFQTA